MDALMLDGNAAAGVLQEVFAVEVTSLVGTCDSCGSSEPLGAARLFRGAGIVLRCGHCDQAIVVVVRSGTRTWLSVAGLRMLEVQDPPPAT